MENSSNTGKKNTQQKNSIIDNELGGKFRQMHMLTERFLKSTDPEGLGHLGASISALLRDVSKIAIASPQHKEDIINKIGGLIQHSKENIKILRSPINILNYNARRKIQLNKELIAEGFEPAINDIKIGREYDPFRNMEQSVKKVDSENKVDWEKILKNIKSKNNDRENNSKEKQNRQINLPSL